jgi:hypothetical protein
MSSVNRYCNVIVFNFSGGSRDGESIRSDSQSRVFEIVAYWTLTCGGCLGAIFDVLPMNPSSSERYQVESKVIADDEIKINCVRISNA